MRKEPFSVTELGKQAWGRNSVLAEAIGICPILVAGVTLKAGVALTVCMAIALIPSTILLLSGGGKLPKWLLAPLYFLVTGAALTGTSVLLNSLLSTRLYAQLYIFFPILAVNMMSLCRKAERSGTYAWRQLVLSASASALGFGAVICLVSALREWAAFGTLWGNPVGGSPQIEGAALPFVALILLGGMAAMVKAVSKRWSTHRRKGGRRA